MAMSINNLKIFINVADSGSITRTAQALFISQPAVSKAIRSIEEELGASLFVRDKKTGLKLTDTGERILPYARQMMLMEEKIYQTVYLSKNMLEGTLRIASLPTGMEHILVKALAVFKEKFPHVNVEILEGSTVAVNRMVREHAAEFGISMEPVDEFQHEILMEDHIVAISKDALAEKKIDLLHTDRNFLICQAAMEVTQPVLGAGNAILGHFTVMGSSAVRLMAREGLGIGIQSALLVEPYKEHYHIYPVTPEIRTDLVLIANDFGDLSPAGRAFVEVIHSLNFQ